jgi:hypothetical protein
LQLSAQGEVSDALPNCFTDVWITQIELQFSAQKAWAGSGPSSFARRGLVENSVQTSAQNAMSANGSRHGFRHRRHEADSDVKCMTVRDFYDYFGKPSPCRFCAVSKLLSAKFADDIAAARLGVTKGPILVRKCDILFIPDVVLGTGEAMKRREFIATLGSAVAWPLLVRAQQSAMPVIGFLRSTTAADSTKFVTSFRQGLKETGFVDGENVAIEYRYADNQLDRLPVLAADLVRLPVAVIVVNAPAALAAKGVTTTVPIVFVTGSDPVKEPSSPALIDRAATSRA